MFTSDVGGAPRVCRGEDTPSTQNKLAKNVIETEARLGQPIREAIDFRRHLPTQSRVSQRPYEHFAACTLQIDVVGI